MPYLQYTTKTVKIKKWCSVYIFSINILFCEIEVCFYFRRNKFNGGENVSWGRQRRNVFATKWILIFFHKFKFLVAFSHSCFLRVCWKGKTKTIRVVFHPTHPQLSESVQTVQFNVSVIVWNKKTWYAEFFHGILLFQIYVTESLYEIFFSSMFK